MRTWGVCAVDNDGNAAVVAVVVVAELDELLDRVDQHGHRGDVREDSDGDAAAVDPQRLPHGAQHVLLTLHRERDWHLQTHGHS